MQVGSTQRGFSAQAPAEPGWRTCDQSRNETCGLLAGTLVWNVVPAGSKPATSQTVLDFQNDRLASPDDSCAQQSGR